MPFDKIIRVEQEDSDLLHLTWMINNICPNSCSYCPSILHEGKNHNYDWDIAKNFFKILFEKYPKIHCSVSGGEPSVSPFFKEIVKIFKEAGHTIGVTSNAAKSVEYWQEISQYLNYICFSYHPEFPDKNFVEKISKAGRHTLVTARIMMHPKYWDHCIEIYNQISNIDFILSEPVRILNWHGGSDSTASVYSEEQLNWFFNNVRKEKRLKHLSHIRSPKIGATFHFNNGRSKKINTVEAINSGMTNFNGYTCEVGLKELFIDQNGDVYLGNCMINGTIGNINEPHLIKWPVRPILCTKNLCHCTTGVNINKWIDQK